MQLHPNFGPCISKPREIEFNIPQIWGTEGAFADALSVTLIQIQQWFNFGW